MEIPVAPLAGSVDRNIGFHTYLTDTGVAPLAGSVDRNGDYLKPLGYGARVAPLAGSVDRNKRKAGRKRIDAGRSPRGERG